MVINNNSSSSSSMAIMDISTSSTSLNSIIRTIMDNSHNSIIRSGQVKRRVDGILLATTDMELGEGVLEVSIGGNSN